MDPGSSTRIITLSAPDKVSIDQCRAIIEGMVAERTQQSQRQGHFGGMSSTTATGEEKLQQALAAGEQLVSVQVPDGDVGLVIGKGGMNIRNIQDRTGANIQIPPTADPHNPLIRTCSITHQTLVGANMAREMVEELLKERFGSQADTTIQISVSHCCYIFCPEKTNADSISIPTANQSWRRRRNSTSIASINEVACL